MLRLLPSPPLASSLASPPRGEAKPLRTPTTNASLSKASTRRPAVILPGLGNNTGDYKGLTLALESYGVPSIVARVSRVDWLRNAAGLADANYWKGTLSPRPILDWYLKRVEDAIEEAKQIAQGGGLSLIGHSAGGWLARLFMEEFGTSQISLLLTLGTPHLPPPKGIPGVIDQTRGLLYYVESNCKPAVYLPELKYVCIAGRYIKGARLINNQEPAPVTTNLAEDMQSSTGSTAMSNAGSPPQSTGSGTIRVRIIGQGYKQVCGQADVWGDGVVPEVSAHLEGALNISLDGVYHSPVGSDDVERPWYGSPAVLDKWIGHLLE